MLITFVISWSKPVTAFMQCAFTPTRIKINASEFRNFLFSVMYVPLSAVNFVLQTESENVEPITGR